MAPQTLDLPTAQVSVVTVHGTRVKLWACSHGGASVFPHRLSLARHDSGKLLGQLAPKGIYYRLTCITGRINFSDVHGAGDLLN